MINICLLLQITILTPNVNKWIERVFPRRWSSEVYFQTTDQVHIASQKDILESFQ